MIHRLIILTDGTVSGSGTSGLSEEVGDDHRVTLGVRVGDEEVETEDDLGELLYRY